MGVGRGGGIARRAQRVSALVRVEVAAGAQAWRRGRGRGL